MQGTSALVEKQDEDLDDFMERMVEKNKNYKYHNPLTEDNWEQEIEKIPLFMTKVPDEIDPEKSPELAALQELIYEDNDPTAKTLSYKDDGNVEFKKGNYKRAIKVYSEAIKINCADPLIMSTLFANRANAHFKIGNYRTAFNDATQAKSIQPDNIKAIFRGACASFELGLYDESITWCKEGLLQDTNNKTFQDLLKKVTLNKKQQGRDKRKKKAEENKKNLANDLLVDAIMSRGVKLHQSEQSESEDEGSKSAVDKLTALALTSQDSPGQKSVYLDESGVLHWPVLFVYPEYGQTDYIEAFNETNCFSDLIQVMFGCESVPWDTENKYKPSRLEVYFEDIDNCLIFIEQSTALKEALSHPRYVVTGGTPSFILLVKDTPFHKQFCAKYNFKK